MLSLAGKKRKKSKMFYLGVGLLPFLAREIGWIIFASNFFLFFLFFIFFFGKRPLTSGTLANIGCALSILGYVHLANYVIFVLCNDLGIYAFTIIPRSQQKA